MKNLIALLICWVTSLSFAGTNEEKMINNFLQEYLPQDYQQVSQKSVNIDGEVATLTRYQKDSIPQLGGEHFSTVTNSSNKLKGFVYLDK